jgi:hypothetical protein
LKFKQLKYNDGGKIKPNEFADINSPEYRKYLSKIRSKFPEARTLGVNNTYGNYNGGGVQGNNSPTELEQIINMTEYMKRNSPYSNIYRDEYQHYSTETKPNLLIAKKGGYVPKFLGGGLNDCPEGMMWDESTQQCIDNNGYVPVQKNPYITGVTNERGEKVGGTGADVKTNQSPFQPLNKTIKQSYYKEPNYIVPLAFNSLISGMFNGYTNNINSNNVLNTSEYNNPYDNKFTQYNKCGGKVFKKMMKSGGFVKYEDGGDVDETRSELEQDRQEEIGLRQQQLNVFFNDKKSQNEKPIGYQQAPVQYQEEILTSPTNQYVDNTTGLLFKSSGESGINNVGIKGKEIGNRVAKALGYTPTFNSVYRTPANQAKQKYGVKNSFHTTGDAVDIKPTDWEKLPKSEKQALLRDYDHVFHNNHHHLEPKSRKYEKGGKIGLRQMQLDVFFNEKEENPYVENEEVFEDNTTNVKSFSPQVITTKPTESGKTGNFNLGNIRDTVTGKFKSFGSYEEGRQALIRQLNLYKTGKSKTGVKPTNSLYEAMAKYAPVADKNNPVQYAEFIAKRIGISPKTPISEIDLEKWADAITIMEGNTKLRK